VRTTFDLQ
jgi:hypothetical protein